MIGKGRLHVGLSHFIKKKKIGGKIKKDLKFLANMPIYKWRTKDSFAEGQTFRKVGTQSCRPKSRITGIR